jgi:hypothetical protein
LQFLGRKERGSAMRKAFNSVFGKSAGLAVGAFMALCPAAAMASGGAHFGGGAAGHFSGGGGHFVDRGFRSGLPRNRWIPEWLRGWS